MPLRLVYRWWCETPTGQVKQAFGTIEPIISPHMGRMNWRDSRGLCEGLMAGLAAFMPHVQDWSFESQG